MPGTDLGLGVDVLPPLNLGSLKGHKVLPRRNIISDDASYGNSIRPERRMRHKSEQISYTSVERIKSWIPEASPIQVIPVVGKPLTPPINFRDDFQSWINDVALRGRTLTRTHTSDSHSNPTLVQPSPPTPVTTPPKSHRVRSSASRSSTRNTSDSRTDSFITAHEDQSSEDESHSLDSPSNHSARDRWRRSTGLSKNKDVGLGLGLEPEDERTTLGELTPKHSSKHRDFGTFDGKWDASDEDRQENGSQGGHSSATSVPYDRRTNRPPKMPELPNLDSPTLGQEGETYLKKSLTLRQRVERSRHSLPTVSNEKSVEQMEWPLKEDYFNTEMGIRDVNNKRLSQASTSSTVVEAMVIQSPPRRRQTLRHTVKMEDMNSSTPPHSNRNSMNSNERSSVQRRLRRSKSPENELRTSYASADTPESASSNPAKARQNLVPATKVPDRLPSFVQSSSSDTRHLSKSSPQQSSRPTTAPDESVGYFDVPPRRDRRTVSVVIQPSKQPKHESKSDKEVEPSASAPLAQLSSPSVPTSSEASRTTSAISPGIGTRFDPATPADQPHAKLYLSDPPDDHNLSVDRNMGELSSIRPRSTLVTPFSLRSARSSTPGTLEVNEATAISIFPHTNKSILVIQQMAGGSDSSPREKSAIIAGNANIALPGSITPIIRHHSPPREISNSPLQNPRDAPQPPDLRVIAPTPANGRPSSEAPTPTPNTPARTNRFSAPITSIKRAISARRLSDTFVSPFSWTFSLRGTTNIHRRRRTLNDDAEPGSKLHPFWRPRAFWDDVDNSDSDEEFGNTGFLSGSRRPSQSINETSPGRTASLTRRIRGPLRFPYPQQLRRLSVSSEVNQDLYEFVNANNGRGREQSKRDGVLIQPKFQGQQEQETEFTPRRTMSLTRRFTESFRLPHPARSRRPLSISYPLDHNNDTPAPAIGRDDIVRKEDIIPRRRTSLTRRLTSSLRLPHRERRECPISISAPLHPDEGVSVQPMFLGGEEAKSNSTPRRSVSLTHKVTGSLRLPYRGRRERPVSISAPIHPNEDESSINPNFNGVAGWRSDIRPRRTASLTDRLRGSLPHRTRPPRPLSLSSPLDGSDRISMEPAFPPRDINGAPLHGEEEEFPRRASNNPVQLIGFKAFAEKLERRRAAREEGKREERRRWLTDSIRHVGTDEGAGKETEHFKREMGGL